MVEGFKNADAGIIPNDWNSTPLGKFSRLINGRAYSIHEWEAQGTPVIRLQNLTGRGDKYYYSNLSLPEKQYCVFGDLLFMWSATFGPMIWKGEKAIYHYHIWKIETDKDHLDKSFLFHVLEDLTERVKKNSTNGGTMLHLTKSGMEIMQIPLPPTKAEQSAIATALNDADALIQKLEQLIAKKRNIKAGAMQELLKQKDGWDEKKLGAIAEISKGQLITEKTAVPDGIPVIGGGMTVSYYHNKPNRKGVTITVSASGAYAGYVSIHNYPIFASDCSTIKESEQYDSYFLYFALLNRQKEIYSLQTGGGQPHVYPQQLRDLFIPIPKKKTEQTFIAQILSDMDNEIQELEKQLEKYKMMKQGMMQSLLTGKIRLV